MFAPDVLLYSFQIAMMELYDTEIAIVYTRAAIIISLWLVM
jgi:hypothetical protein